MFKKLSIIIFLLLFAIVSSQTISPSGVTSTENYIYSRSYLEGVSSSSSSAKQIQGITYFDGLGRPKQTIAIKTTPAGKDMVTPIEYDGFGRQVKDWLPLPQTTTGDGAINTNPDTSFYSSFTGANLYSEKKLELSPLDRLQEQGHPGTDWNIGSTHSQKFEYDANGDNEVKKYTATFNYTTFTSSIALAPVTDTNANNGYYKAEQLYKNKITDEDGNISYEYKNAKGQTILVRKALNATQNADTYYVYNDYDQLAYVIPPLASNSTLSSSLLDNLCYQYKYDSQNRLVEKKLPGKGWEYMVYDQQDRLVLTQDAMLRGTVNNFAKRGWLFTKYDQFGRVVYTGFLANTATRETIQKSINSMVSNAANNETRSSSGFTQNALTVYYTKNAFPTGSMTVLSVNYYDSYPPDMVTPVPTTIQGQTTLSATTTNGRSTKGLPMASYVKNIENDSWTKTYTFYDTKARAIGTYSQNHLGGYTKTETELDFAGVPQNTYTYHKRLSTDTETQIKERFIYDGQNRLLQHYHQVNTNPEELLAENHYNELGQIDNKKVGNTAATPLQTVDYAYNIRGWMTQINDPTALGTDLFGYNLNYTSSSEPAIAPGRYNGNIAEVVWKSAYTNKQRGYLYQYDGLNRLKAGLYRVPLAATPETDFYTEKTNYDLNGNITNLQRFSSAYGSSTPIKSDDLIYTYSGNQLTKVVDTSNNYMGYVPGGNTISYDANGNMTNMMDKNISQISYNFLNLPEVITQNGKNTSHLYRADGVKVRKVREYDTVYFDPWDWWNMYDVPTSDITEYLDGFQYLTEDTSGINCSCGTSQTLLKTVPTAEGYFDFLRNVYIYNYVDHLGNVRVSYHKTSTGALSIDQDTNYYPFGLEYPENGRLFGPYYHQYKYNGKELQETGNYDFGARQYMSDIGRWFVIDPLAQKYFDISPYTYVANNPIRLIDPNGMEIIQIEGGYKYTEQDAVDVFNLLKASSESKSGKREGSIAAITFGKEKVWGEAMKFAVPETILANVRADKGHGGYNDFYNALKSVSDQSPDGIGFLGIFSHGGHDNNSSRDTYGEGMIFANFDLHPDASNVYTSDLSKLGQAVDAGKIKFAEFSTIYLGACNSSTVYKSKNFPNGQSFALELARATRHSFVWGAANEHMNAVNPNNPHNTSFYPERGGTLMINYWPWWSPTGTSIPAKSQIVDVVELSNIYR